MTEKSAKQLLYSLVKSLNYLHMGGAGRKLIHKNLKPSQIFVIDQNRGQYKISDLGLDDLSFNKPEFTAPETIKDKIYDEKSDCYSIGAIVYFALYGKQLESANGAF
jgi:serine/threonine protein kinase